MAGSSGEHPGGAPATKWRTPREGTVGSVSRLWTITAHRHAPAMCGPWKVRAAEGSAAMTTATLEHGKNGTVQPRAGGLPGLEGARRAADMLAARLMAAGRAARFAMLEPVRVAAKQLEEQLEAAKKDAREIVEACSAAAAQCQADILGLADQVLASTLMASAAPDAGEAAKDDGPSDADLDALPATISGPRPALAAALAEQEERERQHQAAIKAEAARLEEEALMGREVAMRAEAWGHSFPQEAKALAESAARHDGQGDIRVEAARSLAETEHRDAIASFKGDLGDDPKGDPAPLARDDRRPLPRTKPRPNPRPKTGRKGGK